MSSNTNRITALGVVALSLSTMTSEVAAEDQKWGFKLGFFTTDLDTSVQFDTNSGDVGWDTDFEDDLGLDSSDDAFRLDGYYKFNDKHRIDYSYFDMSRSGSGILTTEINFGDETFVVDSLVETTFDLDIYKAAYTYSLLSRESYDIGVSAGLYVADLGIGLASLDGDVVIDAEDAQITVPLPVLGLRGEYEFNDKWTLQGSMEFFFLEFEDSKGTLSDLYVGLDYQWFANTALGIAYNAATIDIDTDGEDSIGEVDYSYDGALIYLKFDF
jgi:hypothetical protein